MYNLSSHCGLVDVGIKAFDKDLPVMINFGQRLCNEAKDQIITIQSKSLWIFFFESRSLPKQEHLVLDWNQNKVKNVNISYPNTSVLS